MSSLRSEHSVSPYGRDGGLKVNPKSAVAGCGRGLVCSRLQMDEWYGGVGIIVSMWGAACIGRERGCRYVGWIVVGRTACGFVRL